MKDQWIDYAVKKKNFIFVPKKREDLKKLSHGVEKAKPLAEKIAAEKLA